MDCETPSSTTEGDIWVPFEDGEWDGVVLEGLGESPAGDAGPDDQDVWSRERWCHLYAGPRAWRRQSRASKAQFEACGGSHKRDGAEVSIP
jgi:hypothetical protein